MSQPYRDLVDRQRRLAEAVACPDFAESGRAEGGLIDGDELMLPDAAGSACACGAPGSSSASAASAAQRMVQPRRNQISVSSAAGQASQRPRSSQGRLSSPSCARGSRDVR